MKVIFSKRFRKQYYASRNDALRNKLREIVIKVENASTPRDIPNLRKLEGYPSSYRIRMGDYRIGVHIEGDTVIFADFDHRGQIYSRFP